MTFENPIWLFLTPVLVLLAGGLLHYARRQRGALLARFAAARLLGQLTEAPSAKRSRIKASLLLLGIAALGLALARPQYGVEWVERKSRGLDLIFVLDVSKSMYADDISPSRLERARLTILDLFDELGNDRIGLVPFAGTAFLQVPPTLDYTAFRETLRSADPSVLSSEGSDIGRALLEASEAFPGGAGEKILILLSDGEDFAGRIDEAIAKLKNDNIKVHVLGTGTEEGTYLRAGEGDGEDSFVRDDDGQPVRTRLEEETLQRIAEATSGNYAPVGDSARVERIFQDVRNQSGRTAGESDLRERPIERFQWPLGLAIALLMAEMLVRNRSPASARQKPGDARPSSSAASGSRRRRRRSAAAAALLLLPGLFPERAEAQPDDAKESGAATEAAENTDGMPQAEDARQLYNRAVEATREEDFETAENLFRNAAEKSGNRKLQRDALYNMAHAVNQQAEAAFDRESPREALKLWQEAEELFRSANEMDPSDAQAESDAAKVRNRRQAVREALPPPQRQQEQQQRERNESPESDETSQEQNQPQNRKQDASEGETEQEESGQSGVGGAGSENGDRAENEDRPENEDGNQSSGGQTGQQDEAETPEDRPDDALPEDTQPEERSPGDRPEPPPESGTEDETPEQNPSPEQEGEEGEDEDRSDTAPGAETPDQEPAPENGEGEAELPESAAAGDPGGEATEDGARTPGNETKAPSELSEREARALLKSLRSSERYLPYTDPGQSRPERGQPSW